MTIRITGGSLASYVLSGCLAKKGAPHQLDEPDSSARKAGPAVIVLNDTCISLLEDLFPLGEWRSIGHRLTQREVLWGDAGSSQRIADSSIVVEVQKLHKALHEHTQPRASTEKHPNKTAAWRVNPQNNADGVFSGGKRSLLTAIVTLSNKITPSRSLMESTHDGWLFLAPMNDNQAIIQAMVHQAEDDVGQQLKNMLQQCFLAAPFIGELGVVHSFSAAPSIRLPLVFDGGINIAANAVKLDPISGEGTPFAMRSAILSSAVICGEGNPDRLAEHYVQRTIISFLAHLKGCYSFYCDAFAGHEGWSKELHHTYVLHETIARLFKSEIGKPFGYRLEGLNLIENES